MEYLLKNGILDLLVSLAISDEPPGMKSYVLKFVSKTLTQLKEPNIAHSAIYVPMMVKYHSLTLETVCVEVYNPLSLVEIDECLRWTTAFC